MSLGLRPVKLTYDDLRGFPADGGRHELLDGEHVVTPSPRPAHQTVVGNLFLALAPHAQERRLGRVLLGPVDVVLSRYDVVAPDLVFVASDHLDRIAGTHLSAAPDLAVEVLSRSTGRRDRGAKRQLYEKFGVREYWLIDPDARTVDRIAFGAAPGGEASRFESGDCLTTPLLPGLEIEVARLFEE